jgi:membrane-bound ClpP family serine protease
VKSRPGSPRTVGDRDERWSAAIMLRYAMFQLPGVAVVVVLLLVLQRWADLKPWQIGSLVALWVAKDAVFYPFVWKAYQWKPAGDENPMIGARAVARERLDPSGHVDVRGEIWRAEVTGGSRPVEKGEAVRIRGMHGLVLFVRPEQGEESAGET